MRHKEREREEEKERGTTRTRRLMRDQKKGGEGRREHRDTIGYDTTNSK